MRKRRKQRFIRSISHLQELRWYFPAASFVSILRSTGKGRTILTCTIGQDGVRKEIFNLMRRLNICLNFYLLFWANSTFIVLGPATIDKMA